MRAYQDLNSELVISGDVADSTEYGPAELCVVLVWFRVGPLWPGVSAVEQERGTM